MSINDLDIETTLRDLSDLIRAEPDARRRAALFQSFLLRASDSGRDGFEGAVYAARMAGVTPEDVAQDHGVAPWTVIRWTNTYADRHGLRRLGRPPRPTGAVEIPTPMRRPWSRPPGATPNPGE